MYRTSTISKPAYAQPEFLAIGSMAQPPQLLKWVGNKQRYVSQIIRLIPHGFKRYIEPFVGSGALLGALSPQSAIAGDVIQPLIELWKLVQKDPESLASYYDKTWRSLKNNRQVTYSKVRDSYNSKPNPYDLLFLSRSCYGGVVRFTKMGKMSTPIGAHTPIPPDSFEDRLFLWRERISNTKFMHSDFEETMAQTKSGDVVYCDPPYIHCQSILYGAQSFDVQRLWKAVMGCISRGAKVILSIDGSKKSGKLNLDVGIPSGLFKREIMINCGRSMLRRFQKEGDTLEEEVVQDRLVLTW